jgi:hypothetical protein
MTPRTLTSRKITFCKSILLLISLSMIAALVACSSSSSPSTTTQPPPAISVSISTPLQNLAVSGTASVSATVLNDSANAGVNWTVTCGSTGACGSFNPTATASGASTVYTAPSAIPTGNTVTITATSVTDTTKSANITVTITAAPALTVTLNSVAASIAINGTMSISATVANDPAQAGVNWSVTCGSAGACGSFNPTGTLSAAATTYTAPPAVPTGNTVTITATSVSPPNVTATATVVITNPPTGLTVGSTYVFLLSGADTNGLYSVAGAFTIGPSGTISGGEQDFTDVNPNTGLAESFTDSISSSSTYATSASDSNLIFTLVTCNGTNCAGTDTNLGVGGTETLDATLISAQAALITEFDTSATSTGTLDIQATPAALAGGYEFFLSGEDPDGDGFTNGVVTVLGGILDFNSGSLVTANSVFDINDGSFGAFTDQLFSAGTAIGPDSFGRVQIPLTPASTDTSGIPGVNLIGYEVDVNHLRLVETADAYGSVTGGVALGQSGTFTNSSLSGSSYVFDSGGADINGPLQVAGVLTLTATSGSTTSGTVSGTLNYNDGTVQNGQGGTAFTGTYTLDTTDPGRISLSNLTDTAGDFNFNLQLYLNGDGYASLISVDQDDAIAGRGFLQSGTYSAATFSGSYAMIARQILIANFGFEEDGVGPVTADGISFLAGFLDINEVTPTSDVTLTGNFVANSSGIFTGTITGIDSVSSGNADNFTFYLVDDTKVVAIETDANPNQLTLGYFSLQQ